MLLIMVALTFARAGTLLGGAVALFLSVVTAWSSPQLFDHKWLLISAAGVSCYVLTSLAFFWLNSKENKHVTAV